MIVKINEPIWKDRSVGVNKALINPDEPIYVDILYRDKRGNRVYPNVFVIPGDRVLNNPEQRFKGVTVKLIPIHSMREIVSEEEFEEVDLQLEMF